MQSRQEPIPPRSLEPPPLAELLGRVTEDLKQLARQEAKLAKTELTEELKQAKQQVVGLAVSGFALLAGSLVLLATAVLALATVMPAWTAALIVGSAVTLAGVVLLMTSKSKLQHLKLKPERTLENVGKDLRTIKKAAT
jgi:Flp pilus assembly protein TadB